MIEKKELNYNDIKYYVSTLDEDKLKEFLKRKDVKEVIINPENKYEFIWFIQDTRKEVIKYIFDDVGVDVLRKDDFVVDKLNAIISSCKSDEALENKKLCQIIIENYNSLSSYFSGLNVEGARYLVGEMKVEEFKYEDTFYLFNDAAQLQLLKEFDLSNEQYKRILQKLNGKSIEYILNNVQDDTLLNDYGFESLEAIFYKSNIPAFFLENEELRKRIVTIEDPKDYRFLMFSLEKNTDTEEIEKKRKKYYDDELNSYNKETKMLGKYERLYLKIKNIINNKLGFSIDELLSEFNYFNTSTLTDNEFALFDLIKEQNLDKIKKYLINESDVLISNIIIDYNFEEVYVNFFKDIEQMNKICDSYDLLDNKSRIMYLKLQKIDSLSFDEKIKLHEELKHFDMVSKYYDDMRIAKNKMYTSMNEVMLNEENIDKFKDDDLSSKYGVNVSVLDGEEFFAFTKSLSVSKNCELSKSSLNISSFGGSYSFIGSDDLDTFYDPKSYYNIVYSNFDSRAVVHTFKLDSFSSYREMTKDRATTRINELYTPKEFVTAGSDYNEVVLKHNRHIDDDGDESIIENPKPLGILCYDTICENDIASAKELGIGLILVNTKKYKMKSDAKMGINDTTLSYKHEGISYYDNHGDFHGDRRIK